MRAAVVGTNWGRVHKSALELAGVEVVAMLGRDDDLASLSELELDLVTVATPPQTHAAVINALPDVAVLCEKPAVGLSDLDTLDSSRNAPIWVNYAFGFLEVAGRAGRALPGIGTIERVDIRSDVDLPGELPLPALAAEVVTHPWSWVTSLLGSPSPQEARCVVDDVSLTLHTASDALPVTVTCRRAAGRRGLTHAVTFSGSQGRLTVTGGFALGSEWVFEPPLIESPDGSTQRLGQVEAGPGDPWFRANARSVAAVVSALRGAPGDDMLFGWSVALQLDRTLQRALARVQT
ncbi:MAG: hypothetical protein KDC23_00805 [Actinobacteria bacterium]|nr:hypothetical protein [Actinomycetota bacterium]